MSQRTIEILKVPRAEDLDPGGVVTIESSDCPRTTGRNSVLWRVEPQAEMVRVHRFGSRVQRSIWERWLIVHDRRLLAARRLRHDERLDVEAADESLAVVS